MARPLRIDYPGAWHHAMNRGARHQPIFLTDHDRYDFVDLLSIIHERFGIEVNAYCLMGTHYHLLVKTPEGQLSRAMHYLDSVYSQRFNRRNGFDGPLFRGRFHSKVVDSDGYCHLAARYVHRNPLEARLVATLSDYPWSSYPWFIAGTGRQPDWLFSDALELGGLRTEAQIRKATEGATHRDSSVDFGGQEAAGGSATFIRAVLETSDANHETSSHARFTQPKVSPPEIERMIATQLGVSIDTPLKRGRGQPNPARLMAVGLAQKIGGRTLQEIADRYGFVTPKSAGSAVARFRNQLKSREFAIEVEQIIEKARRQESEARPRAAGRGK